MRSGVHDKELWTKDRYDTRCYFNVRSKADISPLNLPHGALGTPQEDVCQEDRSVSHLTRNQRDDRYDLNHLRTEPWIPNDTFCDPIALTR